MNRAGRRLRRGAIRFKFWRSSANCPTAPCCDVMALLVPTDQLRTLPSAEADPGERIMRTPTLRRVSPFESGSSAPALISRPSSGGVAWIRDVLRRILKLGSA
jgi:hypothetical protein